MRRSVLSIFLILALIGLVIYFFTPYGPKLRGYTGRLWSKNAVALKTDQLISSKVYAWQMTGVDGNPHPFAKEKGEVVFLNFWATWCGPCIKEMPDIQKLYDDYGNRVSFVLVTQEDTEKVNSFLQKKDYTLPIYFTDTADIPKEILSKTLPTTYIIDTSGRIVQAEIGAMDWNSLRIRDFLDKLLLEAPREAKTVEN